MDGAPGDRRLAGLVEKTISGVGTELVASSIDRSGTDADIIVKNSNKMNHNQNGNVSSSPSANNTTSTRTGTDTSSENKAKSCKGCLYYSSRFKDSSRKPLCVGLTRSFPNVPEDVIGQSEMEASKEGRSLTDFRYGCIGYSLYLDRKEQTSNGEGTQTELPICVGLEVLVDRRVNSAESVSAPAHIQNREDGSGTPHRRTHKPAHSNGDEFLTRLHRNANLVANGVVKNAQRIGNQIKQSLDDILYPYRRGPK